MNYTKLDNVSNEKKYKFDREEPVTPGEVQPKRQTEELYLSIRGTKRAKVNTVLQGPSR